MQGTVPFLCIYAHIWAYMHNFSLLKKQIGHFVSQVVKIRLSDWPIKKILDFDWSGAC